MGYLEGRLKGGHIYEDCVRWKKLSENFKDIPWFHDIYKCTLKKYFLAELKCQRVIFIRKEEII